ncbi:uncharacterized protein FPRO_11241 [Fusarium proliferatum ET1]|uniref:Heterokaryon incompatibility domain-containing protein n=1 Tax=Fusarium proliferatum (strain ET1) TaxID=1227346 RepID=A0A1L7VMV2_FUSPR|nr:uncharacterized protein FPRO_11241 [Fusarium proliferatum ET1]CZR41652.1 uncharacterized protein FPRO_11241 [Fusarium proliferatum ET1]
MQEFRRIRSNVPQLNHLCDICSSRFPSKGPWPWLLDFLCTKDIDGVSIGYTSILQLQQSAGKMCHFCTLLLEAILPERMMIGLANDAELAANNCFQLQMLPDSGKWILRMRHLLNNKVKDLLLVRSLIKADSGSWTLQPAIGIPMSLSIIQTQSTYNIHPLVVQKIKEWLRNCLSQHTGCQGLHWVDNVVENPTFRLIDIGVGADSNIHLVDAHSTGEALKYITLSYRWTSETGKTSLKRSNKNGFYKSITILEWPEIYTDALYIARQLEVRYIWVDSLCIVQDDEKDWERQAAQMDAIYMNGVLNLAGIEGHRCAGLSMTRNPLRVSPCSLTSHYSPSDNTEENWLCFRPDDFEKSVNKSPLYERGWTFQERVLSKRTVHFGDQLFWECSCLRASEAFPLGIDHPDHCAADDAILRIKKELRSHQSSSQEEPFPGSSKLHLLWSTVIRNYSDTKLTKSSDRLVALVGIANIISRSYGVNKSDYAAGLWKPHLAHQLLWARKQAQYTDEDTKMSSCLVNHFPSWSWASCPGQMRFMSIYTMFSRSFIKLEYDNASNDHDMSSGPTNLVISGRLMPCEEVRDQIASALSCLQQSVTVTTADANFKKAFKVDIELDRPISSALSRLQLLPVLRPVGSTIFGLVLCFKELSGSNDIYKRLGVFYCDVNALENHLGRCSDVELSGDLETIFGTKSTFHLA